MEDHFILNEVDNDSSLKIIPIEPIEKQLEDLDNSDVYWSFEEENNNNIFGGEFLNDKIFQKTYENYFYQLDDQLICYIFSFLPGIINNDYTLINFFQIVIDLFKLQKVCKKFNKILKENDYFWKNLYFYHSSLCCK